MSRIWSDGNLGYVKKTGVGRMILTGVPVPTKLFQKLVGATMERCASFPFSWRSHRSQVLSRRRAMQRIMSDGSTRRLAGNGLCCGGEMAGLKDCELPFRIVRE